MFEASGVDNSGIQPHRSRCDEARTRGAPVSTAVGMVLTQAERSAYSPATGRDGRPSMGEVIRKGRADQLTEERRRLMSRIGGSTSMQASGSLDRPAYSEASSPVIVHRHHHHHHHHYYVITGANQDGSWVGSCSSQQAHQTDGEDDHQTAFTIQGGGGNSSQAPPGQPHLRPGDQVEHVHRHQHVGEETLPSHAHQILTCAREASTRSRPNDLRGRTPRGGEVPHGQVLGPDTRLPRLG